MVQVLRPADSAGLPRDVLFRRLWTTSKASETRPADPAFPVSSVRSLSLSSRVALRSKGGVRVPASVFELCSVASALGMSPKGVLRFAYRSLKRAAIAKTCLGIAERLAKFSPTTRFVASVSPVSLRRPEKGRRLQ